MFDGLTLDELNALVVNKRSEDYESYFSAMDITDKQKERRIKLAQDLEDVFAFTLILLFTMQQYNAIDWEKARKRLESGYLYAVQKYTPVGEDLSLYITDFSYNTIEATKNHADTPYYYSNDRAVYMAENEANTVLNRQEFETAIAEGKNSKKWIDMRDKRERETHLEVGGTVKSITEPFVVGGSLMQFPKDTSLGAEPKEIVGCRCSVKYFGNGDATVDGSGGSDILKSDKQFGKRANQRTARMSSDEYARAKELWWQVDEIDIPQSEKERIYEELDNNLTIEEKESAIVRRPIGNYYYKAVNLGHNQYKIYEKVPIEGKTDIVDEVLSEMFGDDWRDYL